MRFEALREFVKDLEVTSDPSWLHSALLLALFSTIVAVGVFAYLNRFERKNYITFWMVAWVLYAIWLGTSILAANVAPNRWLFVIQRACIGISALCMFWGSLEMLQRGRSQRELVLGIVLLTLWSLVAAHQVETHLWITLPVFVLLATVSVFTGCQYFSQRRKFRGAALLTLGFILWGVHLLGFPFQPYLSSLWLVLGYFTTAVLALFIVLGMIVLVLEQAQDRHRVLLEEFKQSLVNQKNSEREAVLSEQKYRALFRSARDAIFLVDLETMNIVEANEEATMLVSGKPTTQPLTQSFLDVIPELRSHRASASNNSHWIADYIHPSRELLIRRLDGTEVPCEGNATMVEFNYRPTLLVTVREISARKKMEQQLRRSEKLSALGQLVAGVAHELNNPLAVIMGYAQILTAQEQPPTRVRSDLKKILYESERAAKIVKNLLRFARPQDPQMSPVDINALITTVAENHATTMESAAIIYRAKLEPNLPWTMADPHQIEQVLTNLMTNAVQALSEHNGPRQLTVESSRQGQHLRITIADTGPGIPPEVAGKMFDPFFTTKGPGKGTGLGLSICHSIIQEHRGRIMVESELGKGARFTVELPIVECPQRPPLPPAESKPVKQSPERKQNRVLLVDDEPGIIEVLRALLEEDGYTIDSASNGSDALRLVQANPYDVIISDLCMPGLGGEALYDRVRKLSPSLASRIIFITGDTVSGVSRTFLESTGNRWFGKPFNLDEIQTTVRTVVAESRSQND